ncbi:MAG: histidinol-phosphatase HisJ [Deltaproteobacteria bacterium]|nr:histidinol-phosphatase HisJ [Deltaproteobacteria bacterium]MBT4525063.1 histidinol-phosphatase HisJ [Deltaproteobacteria bacterium]
MENIKWDGHTHSEFCRHGSGEKTALMIEKAIKEGFQQYSITEHAPLPRGIIEDEVVEKDFALLANEMESYLSLIGTLKKEYQNHIKVLAGIEIDFFSKFKPFIVDLLQSYEKELDEAILSIHFMEANGEYLCVDYSANNFEKGLLVYYKTTDKLHKAYWELVDEMVSSKYHPKIPVRIGHIALINKYIKRFPLQNPDLFSKAFFKNIMQQISKNGYSLDFDVAGLALKTCGTPLITAPIIEWCQDLKIPLIYGSDAHNIKKVGHFYDQYQNTITEVE